MKSVVLFSSGLDSTFNLYQAAKSTEVVLALTFDYGQRAAEREIAMATCQCAHLGITHQVLHLDWFSQFTASALVNRKAAVPVGAEVQVSNLAQSLQSAKKVWVPNRNGIFLAIASGFAEGLEADTVWAGFNQEEAQTFPDNSEEFLNAFNGSLQFSTQKRVQVGSYSMALNKTEIVAKCQALNVHLEWIWPCYFGESKPCRQCESCQRFNRALQANGLDWPDSGL